MIDPCDGVVWPRGTCKVVILYRTYLNGNPHFPVSSPPQERLMVDVCYYRGLERGLELAEFEQDDIRRDSGHRQFPALRAERQQLNGELIVVASGLRWLGPCRLLEHLGGFQFVQHLQAAGARVPEANAAVRVPAQNDDQTTAVQPPQRVRSGQQIRFGHQLTGKEEKVIS